MPGESSVRGDVHAEFGGRAGETDQPRGWHRAPARPYVFRFNRRFYPMAGFATLLGLGTAAPPTPIERILSPLSDGATSRRRGRATGVTSARFSIEIIERPSPDGVFAEPDD